MSAALRHAFEAIEADEPSAGNRLRQISVAEPDMQPVVERLFDYFGEAHRGDEHPLKAAMEVGKSAADSGDDPDFHPLAESLAALPKGQVETLFTMIDLACAYAAVEGMALGAAYVEADVVGRATRRRTRPRR